MIEYNNQTGDDARYLYYKGDVDWVDKLSEASDTDIQAFAITNPRIVAVINETRQINQDAVQHYL